MASSCVLVCLAWLVAGVAAQSETCYSGGNLAGAVLSTVAVVVALLLLAYLLWRVYWRGRRGEFIQYRNYIQIPINLLLPPPHTHSSFSIVDVGLGCACLDGCGN